MSTAGSIQSRPGPLDPACEPEQPKNNQKRLMMMVIPSSSSFRDDSRGSHAAVEDVALETRPLLRAGCHHLLSFQTSEQRDSCREGLCPQATQDVHFILKIWLTWPVFSKFNQLTKNIKTNYSYSFLKKCSPLPFKSMHNNCPTLNLLHWSLGKSI